MRVGLLNLRDYAVWPMEQFPARPRHPVATLPHIVPYIGARSINA